MSKFLSKITVDSVVAFVLSQAFLDLLAAAGMLAGAVVVAYGVRLVLTRKLGRESREGERLSEALLRSLVRPGSYLLVAAGARVAAGLLKRNWPGTFELADGVFYVATVFLGAYTALRLGDGALEHYSRLVASREELRVHGHFLMLGRKLLRVFLFTWAGVVVVEHFGYDIKAILATVGVASLALGLAAKDTVENMICGVTIMLDRPFRVGDRIQLPNGQIGDVHEIGLRSVKILTPESTMVVVPNSQLSTSSIVNLSYPDPTLRLEAKIGVAYGTDPILVKKTLEGIAQETPDVLRQPPPFAYFDGHGDFSLDFVLLYWINSYKSRHVVHDRINTAINLEFKRLGIEIPFPVRTLIIQQAPPQPAAKDAAPGPSQSGA